MAKDTASIDALEVLRRKLVYSLHSQAFNWVRADSLFYWLKGNCLAPGHVHCREDFEAHYYFGTQGEERRALFCDHIYQASIDSSLPVTKRPCDICTFRAVCRVMRTLKPSIYTCHAGIMDLVLPLLDDGLPVGVWVMGQVLPHPPSERHFEVVWQRLRRLRPWVDVQRLRGFYYRLPVVSRTELRQLVNTLTLAWENLLEERKRGRLQQRLDPHIKKELVQDMLAGKTVPLENLMQKMSILNIDHIPTTAAVIELVGGAHPLADAQLATQAAAIVENRMRSFESSVTAAVLPSRIVVLVSARGLRNRSHFRLLLTEAARDACAQIRTNLGIVATSGVGITQEEIGDIRTSYETAISDAASAAISRWSFDDVAVDCLKRELLQVGSDLVQHLTGGAEKVQEACMRVSALATKVGNVDMPWLLAFGFYIVGMVIGFVRTRLEFRLGEAQEAAHRILHTLSSVADTPTWERCFTEAMVQLVDVCSLDAAGDLNVVRMKKAVAFIDANCHRKPTIEEVAEEVCLSESRFKTVFRQKIGMSYSRYLSQRRLERAQSLLAGTTMSGAQISAKLGFASPNSFSRWYRQLAGDTPLEFRKKLSHSREVSRKEPASASNSEFQVTWGRNAREMRGVQFHLTDK